MTDKTEPTRLYITLCVDLGTDGNITITDAGAFDLGGGLRLSGYPPNVFRDLGPAIERVLLDKKETVSFETMLQAAYRDRNAPE